MYRFSTQSCKVGVVIPCFRVRETLPTVVRNLPGWIDVIIVVDDACPEKSSEVLKGASTDSRLIVLLHPTNQGVGGAMMTGFKRALEECCDIIVKVDGDDQMDATYLPNLLHPIASGLCDFTKGNRFIHLESLRSMPLVRRIGNSGLTLLTKFASGYWHISDPTNGYLAIHKEALRLLSFGRISRGFFFETSLLIQLNILRAVAFDIPIPARYQNERSSLSVMRAAFGFPPRLIRGLLQRILWRYLFYDISATTFCLFSGLAMTFAGVVFGTLRWTQGGMSGEVQSAGTVALALLPTIIGLQLLLQALVLDVIDKPPLPLQRLLGLDHPPGQNTASSSIDPP